MILNFDTQKWESKDLLTNDYRNMSISLEMIRNILNLSLEISENNQTLREKKQVSQIKLIHNIDKEKLKSRESHSEERFKCLYWDVLYNIKLVNYICQQLPDVP